MDINKIKSVDLASYITVDKLQLICNALLEKDKHVAHSFFVNDKEITECLDVALDKKTLEESEQVLDIIYQPRSAFRVRAVTRCTSLIPGDAKAVIAAQVIPDGRYLASSSLCTIVRVWDASTETPQYTCKG